MTLITHIDGCAQRPFRDADCEPDDGTAWEQPQGWYVDEATDELGDEAPWCRIRQRAWELQHDDGVRGSVQ